MKRSCRTIAAVAVILTWMATDGFAASGPAVRVVVEVTNQTANGTSVVGDEVTLQVYRHNKPLNTWQAEVGEDGTAAFENIPAGEHVVAVARARHEDMSFSGQQILVKPADGGARMSVTVFDVSTDTSMLSVGTHHVMIVARGGALEFTEFMLLKNPSDRAITGAKRDAQNKPIVFEIKLPKGFTDLATSSYLERSSLVVGPDGFYDTLATPPGEHQVTFSYRIDIDRRSVDIAKEISLPASELMIFWEQGQGKLEGLGEPADRLVNAQGVPIEYYRRTNLKAGDRIAFRVSGLRGNGSDTYTWIILGVAFAVVFGVALLRLRAKPAQPRGQS